MRVCLLALPRSWEEEARVASSLSKMDDMQARLRRNLEAIGMLNQQVSNTHAHTHAPPPRQTQTRAHAAAHLLLSLHRRRRRSFHASYFKNAPLHIHFLFLR